MERALRVAASFSYLTWVRGWRYQRPPVFFYLLDPIFPFWSPRRRWGISKFDPVFASLTSYNCDAPGFWLASLTPMTESAESNLLTLVKPWSTWVITSKTSPTNPIEPLDQVNTPLWSTLGQRHGQTPLKPWRQWMSFGTFAAFSKFHLNT
jgi:hypothetical protein